MSNNDNPEILPTNPEEIFEKDQTLPVLLISAEGILKHHVLSLHEKDKPYFKEKANQHIKRTYEKKKTFQCKTCDISFPQNAGLQAHITSVHEGDEPVGSTNCDVSNAKVHDLKHHVYSIKPNKRQRSRKGHFKCKVCDKGFAYDFNLKIHMASVHEKKKPFKCSTCNATFTQKHSLNTHLATVPCDNPFRRYKRRAVGRSENLGVPSLVEKWLNNLPTPLEPPEMTPLKPTVCDASFAEKDELEKSGLNQHVETVHEDNKPAKHEIKCSNCEASFFEQEELKRHLTEEHPSS